MNSTGASESHCNNTLKTAIAFARYLGSPLSAEENIGLTNSHTRRFRKQAFSVSGKILIVIHPEASKKSKN